MIHLHGILPQKASIIPLTVQFQGGYGANNAFTGMPTNPSGFTVLHLYKAPDPFTVTGQYFAYLGGSNDPFSGLYYDSGLSGRTNVPANGTNGLGLVATANTEFRTATVIDGVNARYYANGTLRATRTMGSNIIFTEAHRGFSPSTYTNGSFVSGMLMGYTVLVDQVLTLEQVAEIHADHLALNRYPIIAAWFGNDSVTIETSKRPINRATL